jgi:hypothetical protein
MPGIGNMMVAVKTATVGEACVIGRVSGSRVSLTSVASFFWASFSVLVWLLFGFREVPQT